MAGDPGFTHNGVNENYEGTPKAITKISLDGGMVTELETTDIDGVTTTIDPPGSGVVMIRKLVVENGLIKELET